MNARMMPAIAVVLIVLFAAPDVRAQGAVTGPELWRSFAARIEPGKMLKVRLTSGQRFSATLLQISDEGLTVQPKTRVPVAPQLVPFAQVASLEIDSGKGANIGRAIAIGAAVAAGAFFGLMAITFALLGD